MPEESIGQYLRERTCDSAKVTKLINQFHQFLDARRIADMCKLAASGCMSMHVEIDSYSDTCSACEHDIADTDKDTLNSIANQFGLHIINYANTDPTGCSRANYTVFDLCWM